MQTNDTPEGIGGDEPLSLSDAVKALTATETVEEPDEGQTDAADEHEGEDVLEDDAGESEADEADDDAEDDEDDAEDEGQAEDDEQEESEEDDTESDQGRFVSDNAKVRLADGTVTTIADLKQGSLRDRDYRQKTMELAEQRKAAQAEAETISQQKQQYEQLREWTEAVLQSVTPQPPDENLWQTDPLGYMQKERDYKARMDQLNYLQQQRQYETHQAEQKRQKEAAETANREREALLAALPELKDDTKRQAIASDFSKYGQEYGFTEDEIRSALTFDHRQALVLRDAARWRKLQDAKAKGDKPKNKRPPVQRGGKRLDSNAQQATQAKAAMDRLKKTGSLQDGVQAYLASQSKG